ncbi:FtsX-like permease family protein [Mangrovihabitans endophyticus]|uniref:ABC3 transporter permease C-terminal domain-containing protein n=1 Tax=Mangrovihabitans endophyticus TaxID=1751298 RepID=A0A8J3C4Y3_9ACTN|nr:FtsX-like permease family protein [Mangrovihabitans endophyticus]GGL11142.1 hypothetical protein GCM10012284_52330 [Mangrovihabitans endophyticus]
MRPSTLARLALAGSRTDTLRVLLTTASSALATLILLTAAAVAAVEEAGGSDPVVHRYRPALLAEDGLRPGIVITLVLLALPVLALAGQCVRFGSPARDRRLSAFRLAGATPGQAALIAVTETVVAAMAGSVVGLAVFLVLRWLLDSPNAEGRRVLPTDVLPTAPAIVLAMLVVPVLAGLAAAVLMRKVIITPLGLVRRVRQKPPSVIPGVLLLAGVFGLLIVGFTDKALSTVLRHTGLHLFMALGAMVIMLAVAGVLIGTGWISHTTGRLLRRYGRTPATLLAGRQLMADPWSGSRTLSALLATVVIGAAVLAYRSELVSRLRASRTGSGGGPAAPIDFYTNAVDLITVAVSIGIAAAAAGILVTLADGIVARRRTLSALVATGVPRRTLAAATAWQTLAPLVPATLIAVIVGTGLIRATTTSMAQESDVDVPMPIGSLTLLGAGTLIVMTLVVLVSMVFLRMSATAEELRTT